AKREPCSLIVDDQMECAAVEPAPRRLAPCGPLCTDPVGLATTVLADRQRGGVDACAAGAASLAGGHIPTQRHARTRQQCPKAGVAPARWDIRTERRLDMREVVMFARPVRTAGQGAKDGHDRAESPPWLPRALALARLE